MTIFTDKQKMKPYCEIPEDFDWENTREFDLVKEEICPAWVLPSDHVLGRCIPKPADGNLKTIDTSSY